MHITIRVTLDSSHNRTAITTIQMFKAFWRYLEDKYEPFYSTAGIEKLNKYGEPCPEHIHFNFCCEFIDLQDPKRTVRSWLQRHAERNDFRLSGTKAWCVQLCDEPKDENRWFRYPLKEQPIPALIKWKNPELLPEIENPDYMSIENMTLLARDERRRSVESNCIARDKSRDRAQFKDKLFKHLEENYPRLCDPNEAPMEVTHELIWVAILKYYKSEGKAINFMTISGYTILFQLTIGQITPQQAYGMRNNPH